MAREVRVPITPGVLQWAMAESGYDPASLGGKLGLSPGQVKRWLDARERPLLGQFRKISRVLRRPTATFLLPSPPSTIRPPVAFRHPPGVPERELQTTERHRIREVARLQRMASWLVDELREKASRLPSLPTSREPEAAGERLRSLLNVPLYDQLDWPGEAEAIRRWRDAVENLGVLVFLLPMGEEAARGFSLFDERAPAIAINTHWNQAARIFTLFHEFAHLLSRTNSICSEGVSSSGPEDLERWCERTAAAALMPRSTVSELLASLGGPRPSLAVVAKVARRFKVSLRAAALRLVSLGFAGWALYSSVPRATDSKRGGGGGSGRKRPKIRVDEYGRRTTSLILKGLEREIIGPSEAMSYLDVSYQNLEELSALI